MSWVGTHSAVPVHLKPGRGTGCRRRPRLLVHAVTWGCSQGPLRVGPLHPPHLQPRKGSPRRARHRDQTRRACPARAEPITRAPPNHGPRPSPGQAGAMTGPSPVLRTPSSRGQPQLPQLGGPQRPPSAGVELGQFRLDVHVEDAEEVDVVAVAGRDVRQDAETNRTASRGTARMAR